jgi:glucosamine--fructose-6-phosphate aminotransferase (isomerizing)
MCGVSAVYGSYAPIKAMLMTLNQLERGVQGCGVAYTCKNSIKVVKDPTHPVSFMSRRLYDINVDVKLAIAHNRQPSIGKVCMENTHPFLSCDGYFALAHNGHAFTSDLRKWLIENNHKLLGETDSEVLAHTLEEYLNETNDMLEAVAQLTVSHLSGSIVVLTLDKELYCAKSGAYPLHYAVHDREVYVASTKKAVESLLNALNVKNCKIIEVEDCEVLKIKNGKVEHYQIEAPKKPKTYSYGDFSYFDFYGYEGNKNKKRWCVW